MTFLYVPPRYKSCSEKKVHLIFGHNFCDFQNLFDVKVYICWTYSVRANQEHENNMKWP